MSLLSDAPAESHIFFDFTTHAKRVSDLLKSRQTPTPFTVAIHGEWGSGKTTLLNMIEKSIGYSMPVVRFNAWEHESSSVIPSLLWSIKETLRARHIDTNVLHTRILSLAVDIALRKVANMTKHDAESHFKSEYEAPTSVKDALEKITAGCEMAIFIDDLDRCTADNVLSVLESIKTFFNVRNIKIVMAIDMIKVERAWELRYNSAVGKMEGREHTEKMFSLKLALPPKSREQLTAFVKHHAVSLDKANVDFILHNAQSNPRKIKHMLNLLYAILPDIQDRGTDQERDANFDSDLKMLIAWIALTLNHPDMARQIQREPLLLITAAVICHHLGNRGALLELLEKISKNEIRSDQWCVTRLYVSSSVLKPDAYGLLRAIADEPPSFDIVSHVADQFNLGNNGLLELNSMDGYEAFRDQLQSIIDSSGMVGV